MRRDSLTAGRSRWAVLAIALMFVASLVLTTSAAQAVVVNDQGTSAGVLLVPGSTVPGAVTTVTSSPPCADPSLTPDLAFQAGANPLCFHGGAVMHSNETFALTWDPTRSYWSGTRGYLEQFLRDVADGSGTLSSPYALTNQYLDGSGRAANSSKYGGGCIDYGNPNNTSNQNTSCAFGSSVQTGPGFNYPSNVCTATGQSWVYGFANNNTCLTDGQLQAELQNIVPQTGMLTHLQPGYTPVVVMMLPPQVEVCLDSGGTLCSANSNASGTFCSYHSQVNVGGTEVAYVVQPWTAYTGCDEPKLPALNNPTPAQVAVDAGKRLVSPLSGGQLGAIVDPGVTDGWIAPNGSEIDDNSGCQPLGPELDTVSVGSGSYVIQREWDNGAAISSDPNTYFGCAPEVILSPAFVVPSAVNAGDTVVFDGSSTASTLIVPNANYRWDFGDGTGATGPSVVHSYGAGGNYNVKLTVTDRGGYQATLMETIDVLGSNGLPVPPTSPPTTAPTKPTNQGTGSSGLQARLQLLPQGLRSVLRSGIAVRVSANGPANGIAWVSISRSTAKRAHIKTGRSPFVVIGRGTLSSIKDGTVTLHLRLSRTMVAKLKHLKHVTLSVRMALVGSAGDRFAIDAAGRY